MRVTITGGAGRIARWTAERLAAEGHAVTLFDQAPLPDEDRGPRRAMPFVLGSIMDPAACARACEGAEGVAHLAGILVPTPDTFQVNTVGTWNVLEAAAKAGAQRVALASSINAFGIGWHLTTTPLERVQYVPLDEDHPVCPEDSYSLSKWLNELTAAAFTQAYGIRTAALRFAGVFTPERTAAHAANPPEPRLAHVPGRYNGIWAYVDVRDAAQAVCKALLAPDVPPAGAYVISAADTSATWDTMDLLRRFLPAWAPKARGLEGRASLYSSAKAARAFGYRPEHSWTQLRRDP
jgi:nucleoside-diphosphate-sugar epimerase